MHNQTIKDVQNKILEIMKFIDETCRKNDIEYFIMGGTALGAVRHGGFIPWDDDLDIFMTPDNYEKFKHIFNKIDSEKFVLQEWKIVDKYLEYAKVRMNGTTFIEKAFTDNKNMHHGIYVDIMILHKCPENKIIKKAIYYACKYVVLVALSQRKWNPKTLFQKFALATLFTLPNTFLSKICYKFIYKYRDIKDNYCYFYFITKSKFNQGIFEKDLFDKPSEIKFEDTTLLCPNNIKKYLEHRYGDYMKLPSEKEQKMAIHAEIYDVEKGYQDYLN